MREERLNYLSILSIAYITKSFHMKSMIKDYRAKRRKKKVGIKKYTRENYYSN